MVTERERQAAYLIDQGASAARQMLARSEEAGPDAAIDMPAATFRTIATLVDQLVAHARERQAQVERQAKALRRITGVEIRGATELLERGDWKKISAELQAVAQDGLGLDRVAPREMATKVA